METIKTVQQLRQAICKAHEAHKRVGLVPTMGALHRGHLSLVQRCVQENDLTVVSIFVNPTQFNNPKDLETYPRTPEADAEMLREAGVDYIFAPEVKEMYPEKDERTFSYPPLDSVMEGRFRPGHFNGVCQIVSKLFEAVTPDRAYFGEKDFQQLCIIKHMVKTLGLNVEIVPCPIVRDEQGLALSSRNLLLGEQGREEARHISAILRESVHYAREHTPEETKNEVLRRLEQDPALEPEYFAIVNGETLQEVHSWQECQHIVGCVAAYCRSVRLIDNIAYKR